MSNLITHINNVSLKERYLCNYLIHNQITPPRWLFKIIRLFVNGQQTTDNSLRVWSLLLKKLYSEFNFNKSYLKYWRSVFSCFALSCCFLIGTTIPI